MERRTQPTRRRTASYRQVGEFIVLWSAVQLLGMLPRGAGRAVGWALGSAAYLASRRLSRAGVRNLELAFPGASEAARRRMVLQVFRHLGVQLAEFCQMRRYTLQRASEIISYRGLDHYLAARARGQGVLVLTGHVGAWELSSFFHSLAGYPMGLVIRRLDNPLVDRFVNRIRSMHGNWVISKDDFARGLIAAMRRNETVGLLMDTNMTPPQGVFVPFFGVEACTASGLARVALKTDAAVVPGFLLWIAEERRYELRFSEPLALIRTGDLPADILANTAQFTAALEDVIREFPEQWLWLHRRWKTRPPGEPAIYAL